MSQRHRPAVRRTLIALGALLALVTLAEVGLCIWARYHRSSFESWDRDAGAPVLVPGIHRTPLGTVEINDAGFVGGPLSRQKRDASESERFRIVALGDSCTFGAGDRVETYPAILQQMLRGVDDPSRHFEVVNAGVSGLDSRQALGRLQSAVAPLGPELVTVYIGWNDLMKLSPTSQTKRGLLSGASRFVDRLWLARGARKALFFHLRPMLGAPRTGPESRTGTFERFSPTYFEANLRKIVDSIRVIGARPVLLTLPTAVFEEARQDDLVRIRAQFPYFWSADAVGDFLDLLASYNHAIRRTAVEEQVPMVALDQVFSRAPRDAFLFFDTMHTNPRGMEVIAAAILELLVRDDLLQSPRARDDDAPGAAHS